MSSSLDELQPNDFLQLELDEYLEKFITSLKGDNTSGRKYFYINHFIEFICFHKNKGSLEQINNETTFSEYILYVKAITPENNVGEIQSILREYFLFIRSSGKSIPDFLLQL